MNKPIAIVILFILLVLPVTPVFGQQISNVQKTGVKIEAFGDDK